MAQFSTNRSNAKLYQISYQIQNSVSLQCLKSIKQSFKHCLLVKVSVIQELEMKLFQNSYDFDYPWDHVTAANWMKYPNKVSTHVIAVDVLQRKLVQNNSVLISERLITCQQKVPNWIMMLLGGSNVSYVREVSTVDLNKKKLTMRSCNLTYSNILKVQETVNYEPHPSDPENKTKFTQEAQITAYASFNKICNKIEDWSVQRFKENAFKGKQGFDTVLQKFEEHWEQREKYVDELGSSILTKVNDLKYNKSI